MWFSYFKILYCNVYKRLGVSNNWKQGLKGIFFSMKSIDSLVQFFSLYGKNISEMIFFLFLLSQKNTLKHQLNAIWNSKDLLFCTLSSVFPGSPSKVLSKAKTIYFSSYDSTLKFQLLIICLLLKKSTVVKVPVNDISYICQF